MRKVKAGGGWPAIWYTLKQARATGGLRRMYLALRTRNTCKTCALGMGGQQGGMVNEKGKFPEVCKKSVQAMASDMQGAIPEHFFSDMSIEQLRALTSRELDLSGRLTEPLYAGPLDQNYKTISWDEAIERIGNKLAKTTPDESFFYFSGRSSNEAGFLLQLFARLYGTNNVNNCSFYCHQASGVGLSSVTGSGTATITLEDVDQADLVILIGANPASNHPRLMRSLVELRRRGGKVIVVNPLKEIGLVRFKVPSDVRSMLWASKIADLYVQPHIGGDIAFLTGVVKELQERGKVEALFVRRYVEDWDEFAQLVRDLEWKEIIEKSGVPRHVIKKVATAYGASRRTIFAWAMGITHHEHGVENVQMIANLALARGMLGRPGCGLLPLRGHSNIQGIGSMGVTPKLKDAIFDRLQTVLDVDLPVTEGLDTLGCIMRASHDKMRFAICLGGNLYGSNPDSKFASKAMSKIDQVVYLSTTLNTGHVLGRGQETIILPVQARDEEAQATTQESMFNYVRLSEGGEERYEGPRSEVEVIAAIAQYVIGDEGPINWDMMREHGNIREAIGQVIPGYEKIEYIDATKEEFQIGGRTFHKPQFNTESSKARAHAIDLPPLKATGENELRLMTVRSEGQFNTVVYEEEDIYRGQERRDVLMMNAKDIEKMGLEIDQPVTIRNETGEIEGLLVREIDIPAGNAVMYYPESNILIPKTSDNKSKTPAFKNVVVELVKGS
ncbi:MAG: FdhF/YdeP family oxidoreductase [Planctomycetota bacterium]|nr:FdhF/YdeP family oxidoreductase [Planctomycetota bacterium]